jgi:hypothetical protein
VAANGSAPVHLHASKVGARAGKTMATTQDAGAQTSSVSLRETLVTTRHVDLGVAIVVSAVRANYFQVILARAMGCVRLDSVEGSTLLQEGLVQGSVMTGNAMANLAVEVAIISSRASAKSESVAYVGTSPILQDSLAAPIMIAPAILIAMEHLMGIIAKGYAVGKSAMAKGLIAFQAQVSSGTESATIVNALLEQAFVISVGADRTH